MSSKSDKKNPYLIGVTGSFGAGKTLVGQILTDMGYKVLDTDSIVANILKTKNTITSEIVNYFGDEITNSDTSIGYINKTQLADIVFSDESKLKKLESIIHPEVKNQIKLFVFNNSSHSIIFVLVPLLFEAHMEKNYNETWCIICDDKKRLERAMQKGILDSDVKRRIASQLPQDVKAKKVDYVIDNSQDESNTKNQIVKRLDEIKVAMN